MTNESFEIIQENKLGSQSTQIAQQNLSVASVVFVSGA